MNISDFSSFQSLVPCFGVGNNLKINMVLEVEELETNLSSVLNSLKSCNIKADINIRLVALNCDKTVINKDEETCN